MNIKYEASLANAKALSESICKLGEDTISNDNGCIEVDKNLLSGLGNSLIQHLHELDKAVQEIFKKDSHE